MKKSCFAYILLAFALFAGCRGEKPYFTSLDRAIELQDYYDLAQNARQDSL